jgi:NAD(P) transhydrogenase subunit alpha
LTAKRVAITPETAKKLAKGTRSASGGSCGASILDKPSSRWSLSIGRIGRLAADIVKVRCPQTSEVAHLKAGSVMWVCSTFRRRGLRLATAQVTSFALEAAPSSSRQSMDVLLSSQANITNF